MWRRFAVIAGLCVLSSAFVAGASTQGKADWWFCSAVADPGHSVFVSNSFEARRASQTLATEFGSVLKANGQQFQAPLCTRAASRAAAEQMIIDAQRLQRRRLSPVFVDWAAAA